MLLTFYEQNNRAYLSQNQGPTLAATLPSNTPALQVEEVAKQYLVEKVMPKIGKIRRWKEIGKKGRISSYKYIFMLVSFAVRLAGLDLRKVSRNAQNANPVLAAKVKNREIRKDITKSGFALMIPFSQ